MTDKTKLILSILVICIGVLLGTGEGLWWSKLGWFLVGGRIIYGLNYISIAQFR